MEAVPDPHEILQTLIGLISDLQRKNTTMIDYYIHPRPVPTEIAAHEPRLVILRTRVQNLAQLSLNHITMLMDDAVGLLASYTIPNVAQLTASSLGMQNLFINHYDRRLERSLPYKHISESLRYCEHSLHQFNAMYLNSRRPIAEACIPQPSSTTPSLCRGAIAFLNNRDQGKVSQVVESDLLPPHRSRLADRGGVVLWWECPTCAFKLRYHASNSTNLNINTTDEFLIEDDVTGIAYRSAWLVKCHIYHPRQPKPAPSPPTSPSSISPTSPTTPISPKFPSKQRRPSAPKRTSFTRRKSNTANTAFIRPPKTRIITVEPDNPDPDPDPEPKTKPKKPKEPSGPQGLRYYCPFCIAKGKLMAGPPAPTSSSDGEGSKRPQPDPTCFEDSRDLMEHIDDRHTRDRPVPLLLQRLKVAVDGRMAPAPEGSRSRWDLDLRS